MVSSFQILRLTDRIPSRLKATVLIWCARAGFDKETRSVLHGSSLLSDFGFRGCIQSASANKGASKAEHVAETLQDWSWF